MSDLPTFQGLTEDDVRQVIAPDHDVPDSIIDAMYRAHLCCAMNLKPEHFWKLAAHAIDAWEERREAVFKEAVESSLSEVLTRDAFAGMLIHKRNLREVAVWTRIFGHLGDASEPSSEAAYDPDTYVDLATCVGG